MRDVVQLYSADTALMMAYRKRWMQIGQPV